MDPILLPRWVKMLLLLPAAVLVLVGSTTRIGVQRALSSDHRTQTSTTKAKTGATLAPKADQAAPDTLGQLVVKRVGINAVARPVGLDDTGAMAVTPNSSDVGVFEGSVMPGEPGNSLIEGHRDWYTGRAVFWDLNLLKKGDEIDFTDNSGVTHRFVVSATRSLPFKAAIPPEMLAASGPPTVTLVTCSGRWVGASHTYSDRLLVTATAVEPAPGP